MEHFHNLSLENSNKISPLLSTSFHQKVCHVTHVILETPQCFCMEKENCPDVENTMFWKGDTKSKWSKKCVFNNQKFRSQTQGKFGKSHVPPFLRRNLLTKIQLEPSFLDSPHSTLVCLRKQFLTLSRQIPLVDYPQCAYLFPSRSTTHHTHWFLWVEKPTNVSTE
jgi:hypothetical protein